jgi:hypothetical protein
MPEGVVVTLRAPDSEIIRVLRRAAEPLSRPQLYERAHIDDITVMDASLSHLVRAGTIRRHDDATYAIARNPR